jgi:hypothetical protein
MQPAADLFDMLTIYIPLAESDNRDEVYVASKFGMACFCTYLAISISWHPLILQLAALVQIYTLESTSIVPLLQSATIRILPWILHRLCHLTTLHTPIYYCSLSVLSLIYCSTFALSLLNMP